MRRCLALSLFFGFTLTALSAGRAVCDPCPISVSSLSVEGKSISGATYRYLVIFSTTASPKDAATSVSMQLSFKDRASAIIPVDGLKFAPGVGASYAGTAFNMSSDDVAGAEIVQVQAANPTGAGCDSPQVTAGTAGAGAYESDRFTAIVTLPDSARLSNQISASPVTLALPETQSDRTNVVYAPPPDYPVFARQQGLQGVANVDVWVSPDGRPDAEWVAQSSGSFLLDNAGLTAATYIHFKPFDFEDVPVARYYIVTYSWQASGGPDSRSGTFPELATCAAVINDARVADDTSNRNFQFYRISIDRKNSKPTDVMINVATKASNAPIQWMLPASMTSSTRGVITQRGILFWQGSSVETMGVGSFGEKSAQAKTICGTQPRAVSKAYDSNDSEIDVAAAWPGPTASDIQTVLPAHFAKVTWPAITPTEPDKASGFDAVDVLVRVSSEGTPLVAYTNDVSTSPAFAKSALDAAMASTYVVPRAADGSIITETFEVYYAFEV